MKEKYHQMKEILKRELENIKSNNEYQDIIDNYYEISNYFNENIRSKPKEITPNEFDRFFELVKKIRKGSIQVKSSLRDFDNTRFFLIKLVDDNTLDIWKLENIVTSAGGIKGMQKTAPTILLHFYKPEIFSIWNTVIKGKLDEEKYFTNLDYIRTAPTYNPWNEMQKRLAHDLDTNLWIIEILWTRCKDEIFDLF